MKPAAAGRRACLGACARAAALALLPAGLLAVPQLAGALGREPAPGREMEADAREDHRAWQHGIDLLRVNGRLLLIWGSAGNPPRPNLGGAWPHDIYYAWLDAPRAGEIEVHPQVLVSRPEAQEPPSAAINSRGAILVTAEDGEDDINQRAGLWDARLNALRPYPYTIRDGGHSGHVAALGESFLVVYGEGWQDGGGFMNRGTGRDIHARLLAGDGTPGREISVSRGSRDGWPLVAASDRNWMVVWQRYQGLALYSAVIGPAGRVSPPRRIAAGLPQRYAYDVAYAAALERYVVAGNRGGQGFVALLNRDGGIEAMQAGLPPIASESRVMIMSASAAGQGAAREIIAAYATAPRGVAVLRLESRGVRFLKVAEHPHTWDYMGTTGLFLDTGRLLVATLSMRGVRAFTLELEL